MYLDPGLGSMVIQVVIAALATVGAAFVFLRNRIFGALKKKNTNESNEPAQSEAGDAAEIAEEPKHG